MTQAGDDGATETCRVVDAAGQTLVAKGPNRPNKLLGANPGSRIVGVPSPNDFRRSFCSWLIEDGVSHEVAARMMGHTSTAMVSRVYGRSRPQALEALLLAVYSP